MASVEECARAFHELAARLAAADPAARKRADFDRTLSCTLRDLDVTFAGRLHGGELTDIREVDGDAKAQVRMAMTSDDLIALVAGQLNMGSAWASGRVRIDAGVRDLLRLRTIF
jgi:putative sterol carrier protein